jgi:stage II sporulation protein D
LTRQYKFLISVLLSLLLLLTPFGCVQLGGKPAKKPEIPKADPAQLADEVKKYQKGEPTISLYRKATGKKQELKLEEYIKGVVAAEIGDKFPMEALKAQAIVARTIHWNTKTAPGVSTIPMPVMIIPSFKPIMKKA